MAHICDMTAESESAVYDPRIGGDGNIIVQELPAAKRAFTNTAFVDWAYPTSPDAVRFGFGKAGCYVVTQRTNGVDKSVAGFASRDDADKWADWLTKPAGGEVSFCEVGDAK